MTGDGVNDAPSLKKSDCGIAVEGATEAAQAAADIVFLAPGLALLSSAIKIARQIFQRMKAYIQYRIALCLHLEIYLVTSMVIINETIRTDLVVFLACSLIWPLLLSLTIMLISNNDLSNGNCLRFGLFRVILGVLVGSRYLGYSWFYVLAKRWYH